MNDTYQIILFKNKVKKKIINKFKTHKRAFEYYKNLMTESDEVIFNKEMENGLECEFEIGLVEKTSGTLLPLFMKDDYGRQIKVKLDDTDFTMTHINKYNIEELFVDYSTNEKIDTKIFIKKYLGSVGLKLISKLNNKVIVQNDDNYNLFTFKTIDESERFIDTLTEKFNNEKRKDCLMVKDNSTAQRKYLYDLLVKKGFPKSYLQRHSTTHPVKR
jgi:hypothetical protein